MDLKQYFKSPWVISQHWSDLIFLNYEIDPQLVQKRLPRGLTVDTFDNKAYLSIVPFKMSEVRFPITPPLPFSTLWELNIRTYVKVGNKSGIYFFTLDTDHFLAAFVAKTFFALPYRYTKLKGLHDNNQYHFRGNTLDLALKIGESVSKGDLETWITERYSLFTDKGEKILQGVAMHEPWSLREVQIQKIQEEFLKEFHFHETTFHSAFMGEPMDVKFKPFRRVL